MTKNKEKKTFYVVLAIILSVVVLGLTSILIIGIANKGSFRFGINADNVSTNLAYEKDYEIADLEHVAINVKAGKVSVYSTESDAASLKFYAKNEKDAVVNNDGKTLKIQDESEECHFFCVGWEGVNVELYLPDTYAGEIKVDNDFGRVKIEDFAEASLDVDSSAGDVELGVAKIINADLSMGRLTVKDCLGRIRISNSMGDVEIENLHLTENSDISLSMGNIRIDHVGDVRVDADVDMGNKNINGGNDDAAVKLRIDNSMGNISVH